MKLLKLILGVIMVLVGLWIFSSKRKHILMTLLSLELMVLGVYLMMFNGFIISSFYFPLAYLTITACEAALGLTILVSMSRTHGGDYFKTFHLNY